MGNNIKRISEKSLSTSCRHYAYIQSETQVDDGRGGFILTWINTTLDPIAMDISPLTAKQEFTFKSINVDATHIIKVRAEITINEKNRINYNGRIFEILTIENVQERGILLYITCKERR